MVADSGLPLGPREPKWTRSITDCLLTRAGLSPMRIDRVVDTGAGGIPMNWKPMNRNQTNRDSEQREIRIDPFRGDHPATQVR